MQKRRALYAHVLRGLARIVPSLWAIPTPILLAEPSIPSAIYTIAGLMFVAKTLKKLVDRSCGEEFLLAPNRRGFKLTFVWGGRGVQMCVPVFAFGILPLSKTPVTTRIVGAIIITNH